MSLRVTIGSIGFVAVVIVACGGTGSVIGSGACTGCDPKQVCDSSLGCVDCTSNAQCGASAPFCVRGECRACQQNSDCGAGRVCQPRNHECSAPCPGQACPNNAPICNMDGTCVGCNKASDCPAERPICDDLTKQCVACRSNSDCAATAPKCINGSCRQCATNNDCPSATPICDQDEHRCRSGCKSDSDCPAAEPKCDVMRAECEQCLTSMDCKNSMTPICSDRKCVQCVAKDTLDQSCPMLTPFCKDQSCVQCIGDKDCMAPTTKCDKQRCVLP